MNWKIVIGLLIITSLITITGLIVYNNRDSIKLVSSFWSLLFLGTFGLLINALISLKEETTSDKFGAVLFIQLDPLKLPMYQYPIKKGNTTTSYIMTNKTLENVLSDQKNKKELDDLVKNNYSKFSEDLFLKYILDLLIRKYQGHWYYETFKIRTPWSYESEMKPVDNKVSKGELSWEQIQNIFPDNYFIKFPQSFYTNGEKVDSKLTLPPNTEFRAKQIENGKELIFENKFILLTISIIRIANVGSNMDEDVKNAFNIDENQKENYTFHPFRVKHTLIKKKFRSGHPDLHQYEYWANDVVELLKSNISIDEFWRIVELNK